MENKAAGARHVPANCRMWTPREDLFFRGKRPVLLGCKTGAAFSQGRNRAFVPEAEPVRYFKGVWSGLTYNSTRPRQLHRIVYLQCCTGNSCSVSSGLRKSQDDVCDTNGVG